MKFPWSTPTLPPEKRARLLADKLTDDEKISQLNYRNPGIPRLNVPEYVWWNEALHGLARAGAATVFPQAIGMAATFNLDQMITMGSIIALEGRARHHESIRQGDRGTYKGLTYWSPNVNIFRDPRWGRGHETYGECPFLTGELGATYVRSVQGDDPKQLKAAATPKHFAVHSGPEASRLSFNSITDERDLRETYLPAFKACINAGAQSVMTAYNAINGEPCCTNQRLIQEILRTEWGFSGAIVTDAGSPEALADEHQTVETLPEAIQALLLAGVDVAVGYQGSVEEAIQEAGASGLLSMEDVDRAVLHQLELKFRLGLFDEPENVPLSDTPYEIIECPDHLEAAREATADSLVLLRNPGQALPLDPAILQNIGVIGPNADARDILLGNYHGTPTKTITVLQGIQQATPSSCRVWHARGCEHTAERTEMCAEDHDRIAEAISVAERCDVVLLCLGLNPSIEGEAGDASNAEAGGDRLRIELPQPQERLIEKVVETGVPVVALMFTGSAVISPACERLNLPMLHCWYPGAEGGQVIAETLFGQRNPAGRLPVTFYRHTSDLPPFDDYAMEHRTYRFFQGVPAYPFGFGLSYTSFSYSHASVTPTESGMDLSVEVQNTGDLSGDEVVQVYASCEAPFRTPIRQLVAFTRISIPAGETRSVTLSIANDSLMLTDPEGNQAVPEDSILFTVGGSQPDERSIALSGSTPRSILVEYPFFLPTDGGIAP